MTAAGSKYTATAPFMRKESGKSPGASVATTLKPYAAPTPSAISVNMFRWRLTTDAQPRSKNGQPPHSTTGVASASSIQFSARGQKMVQRLARQELRNHEREDRRGHHE